MTAIRRSVMVLAASATVTAICLSVLAGWQRGGSLPERLVWVAISVVLVSCAHLLPALTRESSAAVRGTATVLWAACLFTTSYGHLTFFLLAQRHAGELRAAALLVTASQSSRSLTVVMAQRADVTARLAAANAQRCIGNCPTLEGRRVTLAATLDALEAEASEIRRGQVAQDRAVERHDAVVADPVTARLAALLDTAAARVDLLSGLTFAAVLEGVACLLWTVALRLQPPSPDAPLVIPPVTLSSTPVAPKHAPDPGSHESVTEAATPQTSPAPVSHAVNGDDLTRLRQAVTAGELRPTVTGIRRHLGCSQAKASALRRQLASLPSIS
ncbi:MULTISPECIES: hypothetical protein [Cupriavidus]|uniref:hypothetical protein n=1 Tax=Cupriavidus TaxID=106589 RepID=UPI0025A82B32|nr:hypothetical protein [Cupriavidus sp. TKC]GMG91437.1 hypothetical protein Cmtc_26570 [Cupriavidus sp. TKC]